MVGNCQVETSLPDSFQDYVRKVVDQAPKLSDQQRAELRQILRPAVKQRSLVGAA